MRMPRARARLLRVGPYSSKEQYAGETCSMLDIDQQRCIISKRGWVDPSSKLMPNIQHLSAQAAIDSLRSTAQGLTSLEAKRRLAEHGLNRVQELARDPVWLRVFKEFTQFFSLLLWFSAGLAFLGEWLDPGHGMAKIGYAVVTVILVSGLFSFWQE